MKQFRADLHIHTVLSPCGSLEMSPVRIVERALEQKLDIIGITDHNTMRQCAEVAAVGAERGLTVLQGVEIATREEVHCIAFFEKDEEMEAFQQFLDENLPQMPNHPDKFGDQVWVNRHEEIMGEEPWLLISGLNKGIDEVAQKVKSLNGLFMAAHIDRNMYSVLSQLGFIDENIPFDALEISGRCDWAKLLTKHPYLKDKRIYTASDAHLPETIGTSVAIIEAEAPTFKEVAMALRGQKGRRIWIESLTQSRGDAER
jgi:3',5'-nucleoside bisphosphate phosphatase